jgi:signal transduction histidine kinase
MGGENAAFLLRMHPATAVIPLIMMTGDASLNGMRRSMALGADDYLAKPFSEDDLLMAVAMRLKKRKETGSDAVHSRGLLSADISRELLTPLDGMLGFSNIILTACDAMDRSEVERLTADFQESISRLRRQTRNYLFYSNLLSIEERVRTPVSETETIESEVVVRDVAEEIAMRWGRTSDLILELSEGRVGVKREFLEAIVDQLVDNAFKFSKPGTKVEVSAFIRAGTPYLLIRDLGCGMTPDQFFNSGPFRQFSMPKCDRHGLGLGLHLAKRLVEFSGGFLTIQSAPETGTRTTVEFLPCTQRPKHDNTLGSF